MTSGDGTLLERCCCAACGGTALRLTRRTVGRGLIGLDGVRRRVELLVVLCEECGHQERVLPFAVLPGKGSSLERVLAVVMERMDGASERAPARKLGVARATVGNWVNGLAARALDLVRLLRHRAQEARASDPRSAVLVSFSAFVAEAERATRGVRGGDRSPAPLAAGRLRPSSGPSR